MPLVFLANSHHSTEPGGRRTDREDRDVRPESAAAAEKAEDRRLFRKVQAWPVYCAQCHNARPGSEKAPYEWDQVNHAHARALEIFLPTTRRRFSTI